MNDQRRKTRDAAASFLFGGGEMGARMRALDWSQTPVGPIEHWPQSLKTAVRILLDSRYAMWMGWGPQFTFFCNDAYLPTVGDKQSWVLGASARDVWAEIWPDIGPRAEHVMKTGTATWDEGLLLFLERSGFPEETYHTFSYSPLYDDDNSVGGMLCVVTEDTERDIGERRLQTLRALSSATLPARDEAQACEFAVRALAGNAHDLPFVLVYRLDADGATARLVAHTGVAPGGACAPLSIDIGAEASPWPLREVLRTGAARRVDALSERCGGVRAGPWPEPVEMAMVLPLAQSGHADRLVGLLVAGVSPRRPFDEAYRGFLELVAGQVASALGDARAFADEQRRAEALAELDRSKTIFFSNVSHEFRTPLTLMLSPLADLLADADAFAPAEREAIAVAHRNGQRLLKLVNTLLDFSRIEAGRVQALYQPVDLAQATAELASVFRSAVERAGMRLVIDCPPLPQPVYVDREMWEKIVLNLVANAFKYTLAGEIHVSLRAEGAVALLEVSDTGCGIPADALPHLFDRFFRVQGALGRTQEGSGIGLALVLELTRLHGGTVGVDSTPGRGSTFSVRLPFGRAHLRAERIGAERPLESTAISVDPFVEEAQAWLRDTGMGELEPISVPTPLFEAPPAVASDASPRATVLVADDNADMRDYLRRLLGKAYEVVAVGDGQQALAVVGARPIDLVLSDVMMPRLDGFGLLRMLRAQPQTAALPVILLSARAGGESRIEGLSAGADDYLIKPFSARELLARVAGTLALAHTRREAMRREEALRAERRNVLESMTDAFMAFDADWRITYVNAAAERIYRTPRERLVGHDFWHTFPGLGDSVEAVYRRAMREQVAVRFEHYHALRGRWFDMQAFPHDGALAIFGRDITEKKRVDEALRASELRFRRLADSMPQLVFAADPDGSFTYINRFGREFTGTRDEMLGHRRYALLHPDDAENVRETWLRSVREGRPYECESRLRQADGRYRWVLSRALPVLDDDGRVIEWIGASTDIHELRLAQQALAEADHRKDEFLATLAHELRNPLAPLRNAVHILRHAGQDAALATRVHEMMERQIEHIVRLVDDLMEVSRISRGKIELRRAPVDLAVVLKSAVEASRPLIEGARHALALVLPDEPLPLDADAVRLTQVFVNLLNNAAKFTEPGGRIELGVRREGAQVRVSVRDSGLGIEADMLPQVFDMFTQVKRGTGRTQDGLGIGLSLVKSLVAMHDGQVESKSEGIGCGSEFIVRLPLVERLPAESAAVPEPAPTAPAATPSNRPRVLVVDDNRDAADSLGVLLEFLGAEVCVTHDGAGALAALPGFRPALVLLDLGMPGIDGHEVARRLRAERAYDGVRLVALTGWGQEGDRARTRAEGFDEHLIKPVEVPALQALLAAPPRRQPAD